MMKDDKKLALARESESRVYQDTSTSHDTNVDHDAKLYGKEVKEEDRFKTIRESASQSLLNANDQDRSPTAPKVNRHHQKNNSGRCSWFSNPYVLGCMGILSITAIVGLTVEGITGFQEIDPFLEGAGAGFFLSSCFCCCGGGHYAEVLSKKIRGENSSSSIYTVETRAKGSNEYIIPEESKRSSLSPTDISLWKEEKTKKAKSAPVIISLKK
jgi:hypothetical protein